MDITELLSELNIEYREHGASPNVGHGWVGVNCPMCGSGKHIMGINLRSVAATCFYCGRHKLADVLSAACGRPVREILPLIRQLDAWGDSWTPGTVKPTGRYTPPPGVGELLSAHKRVLKQWGFDPAECARHWGIGGIGPMGDYKWRLFIPIVRGGKPVSWTTRAVGEQIALRYRSANPEHESVPAKHCLWGEDYVLHSAVIVEGFKGAMAIGPGAVATLGVSYTEHQMIRMSWFARRTIVFDNEPNAQRRAAVLADALSVFPGETYVACLSGAQPDSSPADEIAELRRRFLE